MRRSVATRIERALPDGWTVEPRGVRSWGAGRFTLFDPGRRFVGYITPWYGRSQRYGDEWAGWRPFGPMTVGSDIAAIVAFMVDPDFTRYP